MYPVYRYMDSYPQSLRHQENHIPYPHYSSPNWEFSPSQFKVDQDKPPITFEPWSYSHSFNYPNSTECHGCCKHSYPPGYYSFRPPQTHHLSPAPPVYFHGPYPHYSNAYPPYVVPPSYHPSEQARYEYGKGMSTDHCCGCPNHACNSKRDGNVKIEEEKTEEEQKHDVHSSLVKQHNYPYPIVWIPPGYVKDKETSKTSELDHVKDKETSKPFELDPKVWNGWLPFDLNNLGSLKQAGQDNRNQIQRDDKGNNNQMNEAKKTRSPYPIVWLPGFENREEDEKKDLKEVNASPKVAEEVQPKFKIFPVKFIENENRGEKPDVAVEATGNGFQSVAKEKETMPKSIPVKQMEIKERDDKPSGTIGKQLEASKENKSSDSSPKDLPSSPVKSSKLPPVCLRVEPLPKKKNGNGTSRSPSPPVAKERRQQDSKQQDSIQDKKADNKKEEQPKRKEIKVVEVQDKSRNQTEQERKAVDVASKGMSHHVKENTGKLDQAQAQAKVPAVSAADMSTDRVAGEVKKDQRQHGKEELLEELAAKAVGIETEEQKKPKRELSSADAAILIQSAYRGFEVRKREPLKKLKQIARCREQANDVRGKICALEDSARLQQDEKQKNVINETIMSLLLQLDTIQGLHPSVREIRKSVTRELVGLQEKLDQLAAQPAAVDKSTVGEDSAEHGSSKGLDESTYDQKVCTPQQEELVNPPTMSDMASDQKPLEPQLVSEVVSDPKQEDVIEPHWVDEEQQVIKRSQSVEGKEAEVEAKELVNPLPSLLEEMLCSGCQELVRILPVKDQSSDTEAEADVSDADSSVSKLVQLPIAEQQIVGSAMDELVEDPLPKKPEQPSKESMELPRTTTESETRIAEASEKLIGSLPSVQAEDTISKSEELQMEGSESGIAEASEKEIGDLPSVQDEEVTSESLELQMLTSEYGIAETYGKVSGEQPSVEDEGAPRIDLSSPQDEEASVNFVGLPREEERIKVVEEIESGVAEPTVEKPPTPKKDEVSESKLEKLLVLPSPETGFCAVDSTCGIESNQSSESMIPDVARESDVIKGEEGESIKTMLESVKELSSPENGNPEYPPAEKKSGEDIPTLAPIEKEETKPGSEMVVEATDDEVSFVTVKKQDANEVQSLVPASDSSTDIKLREENELVEENKSLKVMLEKLIEAGKQQLTAMSDLNGRVRDLERKLSLSEKKKLKMNRLRALGPNRIKATANQIKERHTTSAT